VDVKADEQGLIDLANHLKVEFRIIERNEILEVEHKYKSSEFVKKTIGVGCVSEPCAQLASQSAEGKFLMRKTSYDGITIALWEEA